MFIDIHYLLLLSLMALSTLYWWYAKGVKEIALAATHRYCQKQGIQLLDQHIALRAIWFKRDKAGKLRLWRSYQFDFTATGEDRYQGLTVTLGMDVLSINLPPYRLPDE